MNATEGESPETRLWRGVSCGKISVTQGVEALHLSTSQPKTEADLNYEYNTSGASEATASHCIVPFRWGRDAVMENRLEKILGAYCTSCSLDLLRKHFPEELDGPAFIPTYSSCIPEGRRLLTKVEAQEVIEYLLKYCEAFTDAEIEEYNLRLYQDLERSLKPSIVKATRQPAPGWIYLAKAEGLNQYKIGLSKTPITRIQSIQKQSPVKLTLIHTIKSADMRQAESLLHKRFAAYRLHGEWFELDEEAVDYIKSLEAL